MSENCEKFDILFRLSSFSLEHVIFKILADLSALDLKRCTLVSSHWNSLVDLLFDRHEKHGLGKGWREGQPRIAKLQCQKLRSTCTISTLASDEFGLAVGLGSSGDLEVWERDSLSRVWRQEKVHEDGVYGVDINREIVVSGGDDGLVKIFQRKCGKLLVTLNHHEYIVWAVKLWLKTLFTASYDCSVAYTTFDTNQDQDEESMQFAVKESNLIRGPEAWVDAMAVDSSGRYMATHNDETFELEIWDLQLRSTHEQNLKLVGHTDEVHTVKFSLCQGLIASGGADKTVRLWNSLDGNCLKILSGTEGNVWAIDLDRHRIVAGGRHGEIRIWSNDINPIGEDNKTDQNCDFVRSLWLHTRSTAVGLIKLEPGILISTDGLGTILISDFWNFVNHKCGCENVQ